MVMREDYSRLSLNRHLYKMDTSVKRTLRVGACLSLLPLLTLHKTDTSLRWSQRCPSERELTVLILFVDFFCSLRSDLYPFSSLI